MNHAKTVYIVGGGTCSHVRNHLALSAPAYGATARTISELCASWPMRRELVLTRMASPDGTGPETPADLLGVARTIADDPAAKVVFWSTAIVDFQGQLFTGQAHEVENGPHAERLDSSNPSRLDLSTIPKILPRIRQLPNGAGTVRKDIFLVAFKTTTGKTPEEMYSAGLLLMKRSSANLVLVNDVVRRHNMIVTPEEAVYHETGDRREALTQLADMARLRSQLTFTRSTVRAGRPVPWASGEIPQALRRVVEWAVQGNAYKPFRGATVGHFACRLSDTEFLTSIRKTDFNDIASNGMVRVVTDGPDTVLAYGAKPSVGGQSQRQVFRDHPGYDCVFHAHVPLRPDHRDPVPVVSQRELECGSHGCGERTSQNLQQFGNLKAVMLDNHGPNVVFPSSIDPQEVIDFVEANFDLSKKTGGYVPA